MWLVTVQWRMGGGQDIAPAFCSAKRAPTRSACFRNLSAQFATQVSCRARAGQEGAQRTKGRGSRLFRRQRLAREVAAARVEAAFDDARVHFYEVGHLARAS